MSQAPSAPQGVSEYFVDMGRWVVIGCLGIGLFVTRPNSHMPSQAMSKDQPWIEAPAPSTVLKAGKVTFTGTGPAGSKIEVIENGRVIAEAWVTNDRKWKATGKVLGTVSSPILVRVVRGEQSPAFTYKIEGEAKRTLYITRPQDDDYLSSGNVKVAGRGAPNDTVLLSYNGKAIAKVQVDSSGTWEKEVKILPMEEGYFKATSQAESEIVIVYVTGPE